MRRKIYWIPLCLMLSILAVAGCAKSAAVKEFSAESITKFGGKIHTAKIYFAPDKWRLESTIQGKKSITIIRADKKLAWMLLPDQKMYMETKLGTNQLLGRTEKLPGEIERKKVGFENVNGISCDKYLITYKAEGNAKPAQVYQWVSKDNIPVKFAAVDGSWSSEYRNIKKGKQPDSLFELPSGYKKFELPFKMP
jgi:outer membrane lipoprotein-sorting protein